MSQVDIDHLRGWIGRCEQVEDTITPRLIREYHATMAPHGYSPEGEAPLCIHWCHAPAALPMSELGPDAHPARGGFLPPVPLVRRMWAGGEVEFVAPLRPGDNVVRHSEIADVVLKQGKAGPMVFVTVNHEFHTPRGLALRDRQDIVYLDPSPDAGKRSPVMGEAPVAGHSETVTVNTTLLFRYSAITFNGHRIHYDLEHTREVEGYRDLVVHGPLQAALLVQFGARLAGGRAVKSFRYRGLRPLFVSEPLTLNARQATDGFELWTCDSSRTPNMRATLVLA